MRRRREVGVFFPWERRGGVLGRLGRTRLRLVAGVVLAVAAVVLLYRREEHQAGVRATRATITAAMRAVQSYRADHGGACPKGFAEVVAGRYARDVPLDAWGRPLRLTCPGRRDPSGFDVASDGPDGEPFGLDRVE